MTDDQQKWLRHISYGCMRAKYFKPTDENYNEYVAWLVENEYIERYRGHWKPSPLGEAHMNKLKELLP